MANINKRNFAFILFFLLGAALFSPATFGNVVAGAAGAASVFLMFTASGPVSTQAVPLVEPAKTVQVAVVQVPDRQVFHLNGGKFMVEFSRVDGKLVSRLVRASTVTEV